MLKDYLRVEVVLPEWDEALPFFVSNRVTPRHLSETLIERGLLDPQYRYSCAYRTNTGRQLDSHRTLRNQGIADRHKLWMRVRTRSSVSED